jgi:hypothetical protein
MRGQVVIEFLIIVGIAIFVAALYLAVSANIFSSKSEEQRVAALNNIGYMVQDEIILAATVHDGYAREFQLPETADRFTYAVSNDATTLTLQSGNTIINYPLPEISGSLQKGTNVIRKSGSIAVNS